MIEIHAVAIKNVTKRWLVTTWLLGCHNDLFLLLLVFVIVVLEAAHDRADDAYYKQDEAGDSSDPPEGQVEGLLGLGISESTSRDGRGLSPSRA